MNPNTFFDRSSSSYTFKDAVWMGLSFVVVASSTFCDTFMNSIRSLSQGASKQWVLPNKKIVVDIFINFTWAVFPLPYAHWCTQCNGFRCCPRVSHSYWQALASFSLRLLLSSVSFFPPSGLGCARRLSPYIQFYNSFRGLQAFSDLSVSHRQTHNWAYESQQKGESVHRPLN